MDASHLRIALFSGNYNYVRDGANQALNRLVGYLLGQGAAVRIYAPTTPTPAFDPVGDLVSVPSIPIPTRSEYRVARGLPSNIRQDIRQFAPNMMHVSAPDLLGHRAVTMARGMAVPVVASMHTRFETYLRYYHLAFLEPALIAGFRRFYRRCDAVVAPSPSIVDLMRRQRMSTDVSLWARGVDRDIFNPDRRSMAWRQHLGIGDDEVVVGFLGRLVIEKGLDAFSSAVARLRAMHVPHRLLIIGEGPARDSFAAQLPPDAVFAGHLHGPDLGRAVASMDILFNPSVTETFGNVTLEAMASGVPVVAARATGSENLVKDGESGHLVIAGDPDAFAQALARYCTESALRCAHGKAGEIMARAYDWDSINKSVADTYLRVMARRAHG